MGRAVVVGHSEGNEALEMAVYEMKVRLETSTSRSRIMLWWKSPRKRAIERLTDKLVRLVGQICGKRFLESKMGMRGKSLAEIDKSTDELYHS